MDILVKHEGDNITSSVLSYEREHKICTGIGTLTIEIERTIGRTFDPWDSIDIHENGDFKVRYYISAVRDNVPEGKITLDCQDLSKKLVDFFIPQSYVIDYPSYTKTWIEEFLDQAGVTYQFMTSSPGQLLSNMTQLGLVPAYEQIMTLLQLSGWYMYFDGNGKAIIGPLETDLATSGGSLGKEDILSIQKVSDDKMLRNRALVLGAFDVYSMSYAVADVTIKTRWNYDNRDIRSMVVSNSNIPNRGSAYKIANMLLKEFARITEEKIIEAHGARDFNLGTALRVNSNIWRGKGLVTTFGVRMSKDGLITDVILDERCPRLFGFFDFGDYVYVGTYGDGVWRKHLKFDPTWYNFSTGLTDLNITDLHINNGVFGAVSSGGHMYYANSEDGSWSRILVSGLLSSLDDIVASGAAVTYVPFSGIMARATIVDKTNNTVKFGVDTSSGWNYGDYFLDWYPSGVVFSGVLSSGLSRGWILEYDPFTGNLVGGLGSGIYPVNYSGNYALSVVDLENDGMNDYVSVYTSGDLITGDPVNQEFNYGTNPDHDSTARVSLSNLNDPVSTLVDSSTSSTAQYFRFFMEDNVGAHNLVRVRRAGSNISLIRSNYETDSSLFQWAGDDSAVSTILSTLYTSYGGVAPDTSEIYKTGVNSYKWYLIFRPTSFSTPTDIEVHIHEFEFTSPTTISDTITTITVSPPSDMDFSTPPFPNSLAVTITPYFFENFGVIVWNWNYTFLGVSKNTKIWYQLIDYQNSSVNTAQKVYEAGSTDGFAAVFLHKNSDNNFQTAGYHIVLSTNAYHPIYGTEFTVSKDSTALFTGTVAEIQDYELSETLCAVWFRPSAGTNNYANYGINGYQTLLKASDPFDYDNTLAGPVVIKYLKELPNVVFSLDQDTGITGTILKRNSLSPHLGSTWTTINLGTGIYTNYFPMQRIDSVTGNFYILARNTPGTLRIIEMEPIGFTVVRTVVGGSFPAATTARWVPMRNVGNMVLGTFPNNTTPSILNFGWILYQNLNPPIGTGSSFMVLQREGMEYNLIQQESYPIRVDISNISPVLTVGSGYGTFQSNYVYDGMLEQISAIISSGVGYVNDYRYSLLEPAYGSIPSGLGVEMMGMYVYNSGVYATNVRTYASGWMLFYDVPSGWGTRIETSNYGLGGQYVFVTSSGFIQTFYQKNPEEVSFTAYSGMPQSRATIIRLDDRM